MIQQVREVQRLYEDDKTAECSELLFSLGIGMAKLRWNLEYNGNTESFIKEVAGKNPKTGISIWYLDLLRKSWESRDSADILLGLYFVSH
jgi:hypothetical protein